METVPFAGVQDDGKVVFKSTDGSELELPKYDPEGNRYVYVMKEVLTDTGEDKDSYEQIFGKVSSDGEVVADSDQGPPEDVREGNWERESNDNFVYNGGTITNRIDEQKTVSGDQGVGCIFLPGRPWECGGRDDPVRARQRKHG